MFSKFDVENLRADPGAAARAEIAKRLGSDLDNTVLTGDELRKAQDIICVLAKDIEVEVRRALATSLRRSTRLPRLAAIAMANDVDTVALPILASSLVLTNDDLLEIVRRGSSAAQTAIASRKNVSEEVSEALVTHGDETAVTMLMRNATSQVNEKTLSLALDRFGQSDPVMRSMAHRPTLPIAITERLVTMVSDELQHYLVTHHNVPRSLAAQLTTSSREAAVLRVSEGHPEETMQSLAEQVAARGRLTPTLLLRALSKGDMAFFEAAFAKLASIPVENARTLIHDSGAKSFASLYKASDLPKNLLPAFRAMLDVIQATDPKSGQRDKEDLRDIVIARAKTIAQGYTADEMKILLDCIHEVIV
jgi:uncharacterized protein (DUF2336 family)